MKRVPSNDKARLCDQARAHEQAHASRRRSRGWFGNGAAAVTGVLAGMSLATRIAALRAQRSHPAAGDFARVDGGRLHYLTRGQGQPVVMVHGAWVMMQDFLSSALFNHVATRYRAVAFDRPGYGHSTRPGRPSSPWEQARILRSGLRALGIERPVLVGHSLGAAVVMAYAEQFPDEIAGVVFINGLAYPIPRIDLTPFMLPAIPVAGSVLRYTVLQPVYQAMLPAVLKASFWPQDITPSFSQAVPLEMLLRPEQLRATAEDLAALIPALAHLRASYAGIDVPVAIVTGEKDRVASPSKHAIPLSKELPRATLTLLPGIGHMAHHFRQDAILSAIAQVLQEPSTAATAAR